MNVSAMPVLIEPGQWFVVFHRKSATRFLAAVTPGEFKHVSAFGYCPGVKLWLLYDVQWSGTRVLLLDKEAIMEWTQGCAVLKVGHERAHMGGSSRLFVTCVSTIKHLIGLKCVAVTPSALYREILRTGGVAIHERRVVNDHNGTGAAAAAC